MKKIRNGGVRSRGLQAQDLAQVRGGDDGVIHAQVTGGRAPNDNGVIHVQNVIGVVVPNENGVIHMQ
jgi:hypothetical protein